MPLMPNGNFVSLTDLQADLRFHRHMAEIYTHLSHELQGSEKVKAVHFADEHKAKAAELERIIKDA